MVLNNNLSVFVARRRWLKRRLKKILPEMVFHKLYEDIHFHFDPRDMSGPSFHFAYDLEKGFENYEEETKKELLSLVPENGNFYDIGANIGMFSIYFAHNRPDIKIHCFEPGFNAYRCLESTVKSLKSNNINLYKKAIGAINTDQKLFKSSVNDGGHSFESQENEDGSGTRDHEVVSIVNFDEFYLNNNLAQPHAIKIDVEGFEAEVLKGSLETIKKFRPAMMIESSNKDLGQKGEFYKVVSSLKESGLYARKVGGTKKLSLDELSDFAKKQLNKKIPLSNYFYQFE